MRAADREKQEAIDKLREWIKPGDTVYTILDHVSRSGMMRAIRVVIPYTREDGTIDHLHPNYSVGKALGLRQWTRNGRRQDALVIGGCGMDMGFHLVYELSHVLYGQGYACLGKGKCPSNYHVNHRDTIRCEGTRVYNPDGPDTGDRCYAPDAGGRFEVPADWPRRQIDIGEGQTVDGGCYLACVEYKAGEIPVGTKDLIMREDGSALQVCPTCRGEGRLPNPEGPERFDLVHTDGYALRHRWL
jgi:hypothetical protein